MTALNAVLSLIKYAKQTWTPPPKKDNPSIYRPRAQERHHADIAILPLDAFRRPHGDSRLLP